MEGDTGEEEGSEGGIEDPDPRKQNWPWDSWALQAPKPGHKVVVK